MKFVIKIFLFITVICTLFETRCFADNDISVAVIKHSIIKKIIEKTLKVYGTLEPDPDKVISLSLPHAGLINRVWVRLGQRVKIGDKLLEVITAPDSRMQYLQAKSAVDFADKELQRSLHLLKEHLTTKANVDFARKKFHDANAKLDALHKRGLSLAAEILRAPMDGIITQLDVSQGQRVQANTTSMLIASEKSLIARLGVETEDLIRLNSTTPVTIIPVFVPNVKVESKIREIHAIINPSTHLVEVLAPIPETKVRRFILGSRVLGIIHLKTHKALVVPRSAVLHDTNDFIFVVKNDKAYKVKVQTGLEINNEIEISGSISVGDTVVTLGNYELSDGLNVREINQ